MGVVNFDQSDIPVEEERHKFVYFLPGHRSITVETGDAEISRDIGLILGKTFMKAGLGETQKLADAYLSKGTELNFPIAYTFKLESVIH